jgi:hypothetical protein
MANEQNMITTSRATARDENAFVVTTGPVPSSTFEEI